MSGADQHDDDDPLAELVDEFLQRRRAGESVVAASFAERAGDRADELLDLLESVELLEDVKASSGAQHAQTGPVPERLGEFRIIGEIGRGGMGVVYEAEHVTLGRRVALKVLPAQALRSAKRLERFHREARTAARLHHTHIVPIFGVGEHDGFHFYVMQRIRGCGLDEVIEAMAAGGAPVPRGSGDWGPAAAAALVRAGGVTVDGGVHEASGASGGKHHGLFTSVAAIGVQVADALAYAHAQGTLHRDVKPANLLLDADGQVWVTDFGLAKAADDAGMTMSGDLVGTLQYMAPEQLRGTVDARTDLHGLGLVLYELLTQRPAHGDGKRSELLKRISAGSVAPISGSVADVPRDLETIVLKALAHDPSHRYRDAGEMAADLRAFLEDRPIRARRASGAELMWRWCKRNRLVASLALLAGVGLASTAVVGMVGSVRTGRALGRAEQNLVDAMAAFEEVFAAIVGPDLVRVDGETEDESAEVGAIRGVSERDAATLQRLLLFYDRFAANNADNAKLQQQTARAHHAVGEIHLQLGDPPAAEVAFRRALDLYTRHHMSPVLVAQACNDVIRALSSVRPPPPSPGRPPDEAARDAARKMAEQRREAQLDLHQRVMALDAPNSRALRFEQARSHELIAYSLRGWRSRARSQEAAEHQRASLAILEALLAEDSDNVSYRLARARGQRALSWFLRDREEGHRLREEALATLEQLHAADPQAAHLRAALAQALWAESSWRRGRDDSEATIRLRRALELADGLREDHADAYRDVIERVARRAVFVFADMPGEAEPLRQAVDCLHGLADVTGSNVRWRLAQITWVVREEAEDDPVRLRRDLDDVGDWLRGLADDELSRLLRPGRGSRGGSPTIRQPQRLVEVLRRHDHAELADRIARLLAS